MVTERNELSDSRVEVAPKRHTDMGIHNCSLADMKQIGEAKGQALPSSFVEGSKLLSGDNNPNPITKQTTQANDNRTDHLSKPEGQHDLPAEAYKRNPAKQGKPTEQGKPAEQGEDFLPKLEDTAHAQPLDSQHK